MSSAPASDERLREYLVGQLQSNPQYQSAKIIERRTALVGSKSTGADIPPARQSAEARQELRAELEQIRGECFAAAPDQLLGRLDRLELGDHPDLSHLAGRLRTIIQAREGIAALAGHRQFNGDFLACLQQVLISPPREVNVLREQVIVAFRRRRERRRGKGMIGLLKRKLPALYALEQEWLETLEHYKPNDALGPTSGQSDWFSGTKATVILTVAIGFLVVGALTDKDEDDKPNGNRRRVFNSRQESRAPMAVESVDPADAPANGDPQFPELTTEPPEPAIDPNEDLDDEDYLRIGADIVSEVLRQRKEREARAQRTSDEPRNDVADPPPDDEVMVPLAIPPVAPAPLDVPRVDDSPP
jgi:hypothetical protein